MRYILIILICLLIPFTLFADDTDGQHLRQNLKSVYTGKMPFASVNIVAAPSEILALPMNAVYGHRVFWICPLPGSPETKKTSCVVCFYYGGSQKGIEEKYFEIADILEKSHGPALLRQLWVVRIKNSDDKYALILEPMNSSKKDVINITRDLAISIKESKNKDIKARLDKFATPLCSELVKSEIRYQPRSPSNSTQNNGNLDNLLDKLDTARYFLQNRISDMKADDESVLIATYDRENDRLIPIEFPKDAKAFKDKKTNMVIVKESGSGAGTMYYVGYSPDASNAFDSKYSIPAIAFPINIPGYNQKADVKHVVNTPFNRDLDTDEMVRYGFSYLKEKVDEAYLEITSLEVPSLFANKKKSIHDALPENTKILAMTILLIEHMDYANYLPYLAYQKKKRHRILLGVKKSSQKKLDDIMQSQMRKVLVNLAANEENSYHYAMSRSGAYGLAQIIKPTYNGLLKLYPKAQLIPDFFGGMRHHSNAVMAQFLHLDSELSTLSKAKPLYTIVHPDHVNDTPDLVFDLMVAGYNFSAPRLKKVINKTGHDAKKWKKRLPWETQLYIFKSHFVRNQIKKMIMLNASK
ncbi:conserved hypothetical protein, secreted [Candidatus Magnetomorum sp. HK-1]|nr:conserved hypothetical protein, secreted [Candidatus Magnetomorum sp. HK-1]